jgi:hypothetical protein
MTYSVAEPRRATGPRTLEGKARSGQNARTHGVLSIYALLPGENADALDGLRSALLTELTPFGELEATLVDRIVCCIWRLRRVQRTEVGVFEFNKRGTHELQMERLGQQPPLAPDARVGRAFVKEAAGADAFSKLARYEAAIERSLYRALHELQRLQLARAGAHVPPPASLDIDVSLAGDSALSSPAD